MSKKNRIKKTNLNKINRILTKPERQGFADEMRLMLTMNNYGFSASNQPRPPDSGTVTYDNVMNLPALKELMVRLAVYVATGKTDRGSIDFPECNRRIDYAFDAETLGKCHIRLKALSDAQPFIFK